MISPRNFLGLTLVSTAVTLPASQAPSHREQNERLLERIRQVHALSPEQSTALREIFDGSPFIGQGNPAVAVHPMSPDQCRARLEQAQTHYEDSELERICGGKYMAPLYDPATQSPEDARACIDQFEFPDIPCEYPVVWVRAREAALICESMGKRLCDAHEWEGACAGSLDAPDYRFELAKGVDPAAAIRAMRSAHNRVHDGNKVWSYGPSYRTGVCAATSSKTSGCEGGGWANCGSNTFPTGAYPECRSPLMVYDLHGNAAEHMNLPIDESQMASRGSRELGYTEMKGSWFIFDQYKAHEDACRWRAPFWHGSRVMDPKSHHNYHLGFRCCKTLAAE
ncbi:MAG TPA: SUMF1/EgtB/PvdO family nonheme iron enzyme [Vicinamibacteria bacterium]|nr:SUMF1/EgtB/PvdO family nonheme iron enzyme [Vicinamibacteria bacterium]